MKHIKLFIAFTSLLLCAILAFASVSMAFANEIDWDKWEKRAKEIMEDEGHDLSDIVRIEHECALKDNSDLASDEYWIFFYDTIKGDICKYRIRLTTKGVLVGLDTDNPTGKGRKIVNDPDPRLVDEEMLETGKSAVNAFLKKYNRSLLPMVNGLQAEQIITQGENEYLTLFNDNYMVMFRVRVAPDARIEYFSDYR